MLSFALCLLCFGVAWIAARRSLVAGLIALLAIGYVYGIVRANVVQTLSHFTFDAALAAVYLVWLPRAWQDRTQYAYRQLRPWFLFLVGWPMLLTLIPVQDYAVQLVGLRGNVFFLPIVLIGVALKPDEFRRLASALAVLNLAVFAFAVAEYFIGIEPFFPRSAVTEIMYRSHDLGVEGAYRIPATFTSAHAYAGTMVATVPFLFGAWSDPATRGQRQLRLLLALFCVGVGVLMAGARQPAIILAAVILAGALGTRSSIRVRSLSLLLVAGTLVISTRSERLQRFRTLQDTDAIGERVQGSVNGTFLENAIAHPLGNGLGGGGTSMPYFLADRLRDPIVIENEYGRVMMEQGIVGLLGWLAFLGVVLARAYTMRRPNLVVAQRMSLGFVFTTCLSGAIGLGMLTSIPGTALFLLLAGWMLRVEGSTAVDMHAVRTQAPELPGDAWSGVPTT